MNGRISKKIRKAMRREYWLYMEFLRKWPWVNRIGFAYNLAFHRWFEKAIPIAFLTALIGYVILTAS